MANWRNFLPVRMARGFFEGAEDGFRGKIDSNQQFDDGIRLNDPAKKSAAGRFLSDWSGARGGSEKGHTIGKWVGGLFCGIAMFKFCLMFMAVSAGFALWPLCATALLTAGAAWAGANIGAVTGRAVGPFIGAPVGAVLGSLVGLYSATFKRGHYAEPAQAKDVAAPAIEASPAAPSQTADSGIQQQNQPIGQSSAVPAGTGQVPPAAEPTAQAGMSRGKRLLRALGIGGAAYVGTKAAMNLAHHHHAHRATANTPQGAPTSGETVRDRVQGVAQGVQEKVSDQMDKLSGAVHSARAAMGRHGVHGGEDVSGIDSLSTGASHAEQVSARAATPESPLPGRQ